MRKEYKKHRFVHSLWHCRVIVFVLLASLSLCSCTESENQRILQKFVGRLNAREYACAGQYIYPNDKMKFAFFVNEVLEECPNAYVTITDCNEEGDSLCVTYKFECADSFLRSYFSNIGRPLNDNDELTDNVKVCNGRDGKCLSFTWGAKELDDSRLQIARMSGDVQAMNVRSGGSSKYRVIGSLKSSHDIIIEKTTSSWAPCYFLDDNVRLHRGYIYQKNLSVSESAFFSLSIFDSIGLFVALIIAVVICVPFVFIGSIIQGFKGGGGFGLLLSLALIVGLLYVFYQLIEKILFELFLINLPY